MVLFKVLLVDDMKQILDSLEHSINWKLYNMEVAATAFNGSEALDILNHTHIDLVITDIQMGRYGGLELCQNIVDHFPHIKIIIMSGYAEFSYAQKAIKFGVLGYCLKPLEYEEICRLLVRANQILRAGSSQPTYDDLLDAIDSNDKSHILETLKQLGFEQSWCYLSVSTGSQRISVEQKDGLWVRIGRAQYAYITYEPMPQKEIDRLLMNENTSFCTENKKVETVDLYQEIERLSTGAFQFFIDPHQHLVRHLPQEHDAQGLLKVAKIISLGDKDQLIHQLEEIRGNMGTFTAYSALRLYHLVTTSKIFPQDEFEELYNIEQMVRKYGSFAKMLEDMILHLSHTDEEANTSALSNTRFLQMMAYINEHYTQDISLTKMGEELHLNNNYLSQIFKQETGITFSKYIVNLRIEKAKELLITGNYSIGKTAQEVGFNDYFYFLKTFKKITGMTPRQYCMKMTAKTSLS